jgi:hypothetical protein
LYRKKVEELERLLADPELAAEAMEAIRSLIARIILTPKSEGGLAAELHGDLAQILTIAETAGGKRERPGRGRQGRGLSVVAGARFGRCFPLVSARELERNMPDLPHGKVAFAERGPFVSAIGWSAVSRPSRMPEEASRRGASR